MHDSVSVLSLESLQKKGPRVCLAESSFEVSDGCEAFR